MRIRMRLNAEANELLKYYKQQYYDEEGINATYGFIIGLIVEKLKEDVHIIDWNLLKNTQTEKAFELEKPKQVCETTLNFTNTTINIIDIVIIKEIKEQFSISRVHRAFVVKMVLRATYLKDVQKINIYKNKGK